MDKLKMAHDWYLKHSESASFMYTEVDQAWQYADAMQAEADKRKKAEAAQKRKEIREMLNAPNTFVEREGQHFDDVADIREPYTSSESTCQVDWSQAPKEYPVTGWYIFKGVAHWISDEFPCGPAPSFGFTGSHIVERPHGK